MKIGKVGHWRAEVSDSLDRRAEEGTESPRNRRMKEMHMNALQNFIIMHVKYTNTLSNLQNFSIIQIIIVALCFLGMC